MARCLKSFRLGVLGAVRKALAALLAIVFFLVFPFGLVATGVQTVLLNPGFYKSQLVKNNVYAKSYAFISSALGESKQFSRDIPLSSAEMEQVLREVLPADFMQRQTETAIDGFFAWLGSSDPAPRVNISLGEVKARMPRAIAAAIERKLMQLPPCAPGQRLRENEMPQCLPVGVNVETLKVYAAPEILRVGQEMANVLPDNVNLAEVFAKATNGDRNAQPALASLKQFVGTFKLASIVVYAALAVLLLLIGALAYGPAGPAFKWVGMTLLVSGLLYFLFFLSAHFIGLGLVEQSVGSGLHQTQGAVAATFVGLSSSIVLDFITRLYVESGIAAAVGLVLFVVGRRF